MKKLIIFGILTASNLYAGTCTFDATVGKFSVQKSVEVEGSHKCGLMINNVLKNFRATFFSDEKGVRKAYCGFDHPEIIDVSYRVQYNVDGSAEKKITKSKKDFCIPKAAKK